MSTSQKPLDYPSVNFIGACGEASGNTPNSATSIGMQVNQSAEINGSPTSNCMIGNDGAVVYGFWLTKTANPIYTYQVTVDAQGPSGLFSGSFYLAFTDGTGDTYYLSIFSSTRELHTVDFNSSNPAIMKVWWCDNSFTAPSSQTVKPDFRATTPVRG